MRVIITRLRDPNKKTPQEKLTEKLVRTNVSMLEHLGHSSYRLISPGESETISNVIKIRSFT